MQFKQGVIVPIPKGENDLCCKDNYRGITLLPVISKMFEKCIIQRVEKWAVENNVINAQQGASQAKYSSIHVFWLANEMIAKYREKGNTVYTCTLDTKKAFDTEWQSGLFYKLHKAGLCRSTLFYVYVPHVYQ